MRGHRRNWVLALEYWSFRKPGVRKAAEFSCFQTRAPEQEPAGGNAEVDPYHQQLNVRKNRAQKFLQEESSCFLLLAALTMFHLLSEVTHILFKLANLDRESMGIEQAGADRARAKRRRLSKGPPIHAGDVENRQYSLTDILSGASRLVRQIWGLLQRSITRTIFCVAAAYFPATRPESDMFGVLVSDLLQVLASLKFRILNRFEIPPFSMLDLNLLSPDDSEESVGQRKLKEFEAISECCLDPFWGRPVAEYVRKEDSDPVGVLKDHVHMFRQHTRPVSVREEAYHAMQRKWAGGNIARPRAFHRQAAACVITTAGGHWTARGGRDLKNAGIQMRRAMTQVRQDRIKHRRPQQFGNPMFFYIATMQQSQPGQQSVYSRIPYSLL